MAHRKAGIYLLIISLSALNLVVNSADIEKGLFLYLPIDEGTGGTVKDWGPNNFKTEMSKKRPKWVQGNQPDFGKALEFNGKDNYVKIDAATQGKDFDAHIDKNSGMTICAWVKVIKTATDTHGQTRQPIVMKGAGGAWEFALYDYDSIAPGMSVWTCPGSGVSEPSGGTLGTNWRYQCGTYNVKEGVKVYLDGKKDIIAQGGNNGEPCKTGTRPIFIAHREDGQFLNAIIAQVRMWERILSVNEMNMAMKTTSMAVRHLNKLSMTWGKIKPPT